MGNGISGQQERIGVRFERDHQAALPLPSRAFDSCVFRHAVVDKYQTVAFDTVRYSVPRRWAFEKVLVKAFVDRIEVVAQGQLIARHRRGYERGALVIEALHFLVTRGRRPATLDHAPVFRDWKLPALFGALRHELETRHGAFTGARQYIRVLQLLAEHPLARVTQAIEHCRLRGLTDAERIRARTLDLARSSAPATEPPEAALVPSPWPHLEVPAPRLECFDRLLTSGGKAHE